jgi:hypothetical protein
MNLLRRAAQFAIQENSPNLTPKLLARAFDNRLAGRRRRISNPFVGGVPELVVEFEAEELYKSNLDRRKYKRNTD